MSVHLILGGARSGKSSFAEKFAKDLEQNEQSQVYYIATAQSLDGEMSARIKHHQEQRPDHWSLIESPIELANAIKKLIVTDFEHDKNSNIHLDKSKQQKPMTILVDCLTLWLTNCLCSVEKNSWLQEKKQFIDVLTEYEQTSEINILLVSNEVGHGIVPMGELSRNFVDEAGWLHQDVAAIATRVDFVMAGIALSLKSSPLVSNLISSKALNTQEQK